MPWTHDGGYHIMTQDGGMACGLCCVAMVVRIMTRGRTVLTERELLCEATSYGAGHYTYPANELAGANWTPLVMLSRHDTGDGTQPATLAKLLVDHGVAGARARVDTLENMKNAMRRVRPGHPLIAGVHWWDGDVRAGGHWVVVVGRNTHFGRASDYTVLDPGSARVVHNSGSTSYRPPYQTPGSGYFLNDQKTLFVTID